MKKTSVLALTLALAMAMTVMAACKDNDNDNNTNSGGTSSNPPVSSEAPSKAESGKLTSIHEAVKGAYGEAYIPSMAYDETQLQEIFGIDPSWVKEVVAEGPMISAHVDTFIGIEAVEGKAEDVEKALNAYRQGLVDDTMQYPMNIPKIQASSVERVDDYVFFMLLGDPDAAMDAADENESLEIFKKETQKGVDAVKEALGIK